ncbi:uncharacterized protein JCM6883_000574 [Sporobolomyces salmoneus]|uniref:uncharacterized protein n=1 Tax=Sporobolomyces salmoneus TaxID=183962 RepID=UPI00317DD35D
MSTAFLTTTEELVQPSSEQRGLAYLPVELLRKIAKELSSQSDLRIFALLCRSTTLPARELLFHTFTLPTKRATFFGSEYLVIAKDRIPPFPDLARCIVLSRVERLSVSPLLLQDFPNVQILAVSGRFILKLPQRLHNFTTVFDNITRLKLKTLDRDHSHETLRVFLEVCRNIVELDIGTDLLTLEDPFSQSTTSQQSALVLPNLRRLVLRSPLYLSLPSIEVISPDSLRQVRILELDFEEESVGRTWYEEIGFPVDFFDFFGTSIEHVYFNFPLYSKRSNVDALANRLSKLTSLRTLSLASISSGAAYLFVGLPQSCKKISIHNEDGAPDWMGLQRFFLDNVGESSLEELRGKCIRMDHSDCRFCDENFQKEVERKCQKLGIQLVISEGGVKRRSE